MGKDYYKTLGVDKSASKEEIKKAFRKMAHEHHPDKQGGSDAKFKEASEAYSVLSDDAKRRQYDTFGQSGAGFGGGQGGFQGGQGFNGFDFSQFTGANGQGFEFDLGDIFSEFFGGGGRRPRRGSNITIDIKMTFKEAAFGITKEINVNNEKIAVTIPPGVENGQALRVQGKGENGDGGRGDLIIRIWVEKHPVFRKEGYNLIMELPLKLTTALLGATVDIETLDGKIELKIPAGTTHHEILRVRNKGVMTERGKRGDLLIVTEVVMPKKLSKEAQKLVEELRKEGI
ncbi:MAG: DnaJ C-terminal domain-containing protein [bacterium]|nr:DnaJ C-terminal domain-containing protein [bacterium]